MKRYSDKGLYLPGIAKILLAFEVSLILWCLGCVAYYIFIAPEYVTAALFFALLLWNVHSAHTSLAWKDDTKVNYFSGQARRKVKWGANLWRPE